jgi:histone-lysine N-methyltransferase SETD1
VDGEKRITLFSMRNLRAGEELTYNYQFAIEVDPELKIPCYCGSRSCFGTMN